MTIEDMEICTICQILWKNIPSFTCFIAEGQEALLRQATAPPCGGPGGSVQNRAKQISSKTSIIENLMFYTVL